MGRCLSDNESMKPNFCIKVTRAGVYPTMSQ
jgi:hypothetical protein